MLAIVCGGGKYPLEIANCCKDANIEFILVFVEGSTDKSLHWPSAPHETFGICEITRLLSFLKDNGVASLIFAGHIKRPNFFTLSLDDTAKQWLKRIGRKVFAGDDGLLRSIAELFASEGIEVINPHKYIESIKVHDGLLTIHKPSEQEISDICKGIRVLNDLSIHDVGQCIVIEHGLVIGIECIEGTDALISRCKMIKKTRHDGVLVKMSKIGQDNRFDLPTIGLSTIENCHKAGLRGIAIEKTNCIFLDREDAVKLANEYGMFIIAVSKEQELHKCIKEYL